MAAGMQRFLLFIAVSVLTRALVMPIAIVDEASYIVGAREILRGRTLYADVADHHPPLAYYYYAIAQLLGPGMFSVRLLTHVLVVPLTALAASAFFRHDRRGLVAGLAYLSYGASFVAHDMLSVNCELLLLLPASWAVVLLREEDDALRSGRALRAGLLVGAAILFKYQAILWLPAMLLAQAYAGRGRRGSGALAGAALAGGAALPLLASYAFFAARGAGPDFLYWNVTHNLSYAANPVPLGEALRKGAVVGGGFALATLPLLWGVAKSAGHCKGYQRVLVLGLTLLTVPAGALGLRFYPHYFVQLYWPLAVASAPALAVALQLPLERAGRLVVAHAAFVLVGFTLANGWLYYAEHTVYTETRSIFVDVGTRLQRDPCHNGGSLFVWGYAPGFYFRSGLAPASRFIFVESTIVGYVPGNRASTGEREASRHRISPRHWDWLMSDLERNEATYVLDTAPSGLYRWQNYPLRDFPRLSAYLKEKYDILEAMHGVVIYRRKGCAP